MLIINLKAIAIPAIALCLMLVGCEDKGSYPTPVLGVIVDKNLIVLDVYEGRAAEEIGIQVQDKLLTFNGNKLATPEEWAIEISKLEVYETYDVTVERAGKQLTFTVTALRPSIRKPGPTPTFVPTDLYSLH